jgi:two-component system sensor histidine kinase HydH
LSDIVTVQGFFTIASCAIHVGLAVVALQRRAKSPLAPPVLALALASAGWTFCSFAYDLTGVRTWHYVDISLSPLIAPAAFWFVVVFTGLRRQLRKAVVFVFVIGGGYGIYSGLGFADRGAAAFESSNAWAVVYTVISTPVVVSTTYLLIAHLRSELAPVERQRTLLLTGALAAAAMFGATDIAAALYVDVPRLGSLATSTVGIVFTFLSARVGLLEDRPVIGSGLFVAITVLVAVGAFVVLDHVFAANTAAVGVAVVAVTVVLVLFVRRFATTASAASAHRRKLAFLGRLSDQLAHDLRNPVAAIRGAADLLLEEHRRGKPLEAQIEFVDLIRREADRLARLIETYRRFGRVELQTSEVDLRAMLDAIAAAPWISGAAVDTDIEADLPLVSADPDLLAVVFENLIKNAIEADAKRVTVRATAAHGAIAVAIGDDGKGMDARERELAFEELYTTKDGGTGLGLPFARRIVEAHGGRLHLASERGRGTTVTVTLPVGARA